MILKNIVKKEPKDSKSLDVVEKPINHKNVWPVENESVVNDFVL